MLWKVSIASFQNAQSSRRKAISEAISKHSLSGQLSTGVAPLPMNLIRVKGVLGPTPTYETQETTNCLPKQDSKSPVVVEHPKRRKAAVTETHLQLSHRHLPPITRPAGNKLGFHIVCAQNLVYVLEHNWQDISMHPTCHLVVILFLRWPRNGAQQCHQSPMLLQRKSMSTLSIETSVVHSPHLQI